jgi:geranylgeranyl diphosphate synthase type II
MLSLIEERLKELIPSRKDPLLEAAKYSLLAPGKRLRPQLVLASAEAFGADLKKALDVACAIEMVHTYSLVHDDLPCMDDDDLRRGLPSLHKVYGEAIALLAGDYLLTYSFEVLAKAPFLSAEQKIELVQILSFASGSEGMIGGQAIDISSEGKKIDHDLLMKMHAGKTAALLAASLECGAIVANASMEQRQKIRRIGLEIGLAYQILDDILDATKTTKQLGKPAGSDAKKNKPTAISVYGLNEAQKKLEKLKKTIFQELTLLPNPLQDKLKLLLNRSH